MRGLYVCCQRWWDWDKFILGIPTGLSGRDLICPFVSGDESELACRNFQFLRKRCAVAAINAALFYIDEDGVQYHIFAQ